MCTQWSAERRVVKVRLMSRSANSVNRSYQWPQAQTGDPLRHPGGFKTNARCLLWTLGLSDRDARGEGGLGRVAAQQPPKIRQSSV